jgi:hypothetical protein
LSITIRLALATLCGYVSVTRERCFIDSRSNNHSVRGIEEKEALEGRDWKGIYYCKTEGRFCKDSSLFSLIKETLGFNSATCSWIIELYEKLKHFQ